ncbi:membrane protein insertion efficiency factor YidD [Dehalobacterium formicoaceticum]|uniref:Putative membrane protein insertion efficiency factor n=1 Tax=Dehalobacterium formicoaceticum TaxID=51515 RepID=A0ABT1Y439_9FIRM|nr:membrane protein insertion efficiency factor YidD [Dehalobacterium formicoaceticum]MCR6545644.1 membrane protein insertion efficiency factor YidD [Dehalobacterium formicoaceticum]
MTGFLIFFIRIYQKIISPILPGKCRFYPTCSQYWIDALNKYGFFIGVWKGLKRISKCHPWHPGGYDPA